MDKFKEGWLFDLGEAMASKGVDALGISHDTVAMLFRRHAMGDFGDWGKYSDVEVTEAEMKGGMFATDDDLKLNKIAIDGGNFKAIMSEYQLPDDTRVWVRTDILEGGNRSVIMLPSEH